MEEAAGSCPPRPPVRLTVIRKTGCRGMKRAPVKQVALNSSIQTLLVIAHVAEIQYKFK